MIITLSVQTDEAQSRTTAKPAEDVRIVHEILRLAALRLELHSLQKAVERNASPAAMADVLKQMRSGEGATAGDPLADLHIVAPGPTMSEAPAAPPAPAQKPNGRQYLVALTHPRYGVVAVSERPWPQEDCDRILAEAKAGIVIPH